MDKAVDGAPGLRCELIRPCQLQAASDALLARQPLQAAHEPGYRLRVLPALGTNARQCIKRFARLREITYALIGKQRFFFVAKLRV